MKKIILFLVFSLITVNVYSQGATCTAATAFCGADGTTPSLIFPNATTGGGGAFACLGSTPRPAWFYFKVDQSGTLIFDIIQNTAFNAAGFPVGTPLDVDFAVWGPFASATGNCSNLINNCPGQTGCRNNTLFPGDYPRPAPGNLVDCSYDGSPVEKMTIAGATPGQYYLAVVTNFAGPAGFIKLEQRQPILPTYGSTDCDIVCGISLGPDRNECAGTSINITTTFALPITSGTAPFQWLLGGVPQPQFDNMQTITVSTPGTWSVKTKRPGGCYEVTDSMVLSYYAPIPVTQPTDIVLCTSSAAPYIFPSINKQAQVLGALPASDYTVTHHTTQTAADNGAPTIPFASLTNYSISSSPTRIYVRVEDNTTGCATTRFFDLIVAAAPAGTFSYASPSYCTSVTTPQPIVPSVLTPSGTFTTNPTGLTINSTTGEIIPSTSTPGNYVVKYEIAASPSCPLFSTTTTVTINQVLTPTINCGTSTTTSVIFDWATVTGATGYDVSYQINANPIVNVGAIGNVLTYSVSSLTPGDTVIITVTPTGPAGSCFLSNTQSCIANNCTPPTVAISYSSPSVPNTSFCESDTVPKLVYISGTGLFTPGTYAASPNTLIINPITGEITPNGSPAAVYTVTYSVTTTPPGCSPVTATTLVTINALPTISGNLNACIGSTTQLVGSATANATNPWVSSNTGVATVSNTGLVTGVSLGSTIITYTNSNGCVITATVTVNALPTISGTLNTCVGSTTQLVGSGTPDATTPWTSSNTGVATVSSTGLVTGVLAGTTIITYTNSNGCVITATVTINALPTISGTLNACVGLTTQLVGSATANAITPWTSSNTAVATVSNTGLVTGVSAGTSIITYTNSNGCVITATVAINALPTISGTLNTCVGSTTQLIGSGTANATTPWTSSNTAVATVSNTGLVAGVSVGSTIITYTNDNGCVITATVTVNALPTISGTLNACVGLTTQLVGSATANATNPWVSSNTGVATVSNTGLVTGVLAGTTIITYTNSNGCVITATVTINALPTITGTLNACIGLTTQLVGSATANATTPWTSSNTGVATVGNTGLVTGVSLGSTIITYTNSNGCVITATVTVNALPTISGTLVACVGSTTQLVGSGTANTTNPWISSNTGVATVSSTGLVTGVLAGTTIITYTNSNGCVITATVTINALPTISGILNACIGLTTQLVGSATANAVTPWTSSNTAVATVNNTGLVTGVSAGTTIITYTNSNGCIITATVTINALPTITGTLNTCIGSTTQLVGSATANATNPWTSSNTGVATVSNTGLVTGVSLGSTIITYTNSNGCVITATVTVNALPTITGTLNACIGLTTQLVGSATANAVTPWTSSNTGVATVNNTGLVTGVSAGTTIITYTNSNGCIITATVTINALPTITGTLNACIGLTTQLVGSATANATTPWTSSNTGVATVNNTGLVTGVSVGSTTITYTNSNGCVITATVTVNALPTISGTLNACVGSTTQLVGSGTANATNPWVSSNTGVATVNNTGLVTGVLAGTTIITYTNSNGCVITATVTINALPTITGTLNACVGLTTQLVGSATADATTPWVSSNTGVATVSNTGLVTGVSTGTTIITYKNSNGCVITATVTINALPTITGTLSACVGLTTQLTGSATANATTPWVSSNTAVATVSNTGLVTGVSAGTAIITYTNSNGCVITATVTVNGSPTISGTLNACIGFTTQLTGSGTPNATTPWISSNTLVATVSNTGLVTGVSGGTAVITYTTDSNGCTATATVTINNPSAPIVTTPIPYCLNDSASALTATGSNLLWYTTATGGTGSTTAPIPVTNVIGSVSYYVSQTVGNCESPRAAITVNISEPPATVVATPSEYFADLQTITVTVTPTGIYEYQIDNGVFQSSNIFANVGAGQHIITVRNECDSISTTAYIVDYPRYFTPNADGYHDTWNIPELKGQANSKVLIFDRFGKLIKEIRPSGSGWNGTFNGKELPSTDYWFIVTYEEKGITKEHKAHFSMKR